MASNLSWDGQLLGESATSIKPLSELGQRNKQKIEDSPIVHETIKTDAIISTVIQSRRRPQKFLHGPHVACGPETQAVSPK